MKKEINVISWLILITVIIAFLIAVCKSDNFNNRPKKQNRSSDIIIIPYGDGLGVF